MSRDCDDKNEEMSLNQTPWRDRRSQMNKTYTYNFPEGPKMRGTSGALMGLAFILYDYQWSCRIQSWNFIGVLSPYWRLLHCTRGTCRVQSKNSVFEMDSTAVLLIPPDVISDFSSDVEIDMLYAHFLPVFPVSLESVVHFDTAIKMQTSPAHRGLTTLLTAPSRTHRPMDCSALLFRALLDVCFADLLAPYVGETRRHPLPDPRMMKMLTWMREHYAEPLTNEQIAQAAGLEADHAMRVCRLTTGQTLHVHLRNVRLSQATRLLADGDASIKQIASECGFANRFHFTRAFVDRFGIGPATFRRQISLGLTHEFPMHP